MLSLILFCAATESSTHAATLDGDLVSVPVVRAAKRLRFRVDPVTDGAVLTLAAGLGLGAQVVSMSNELGVRGPADGPDRLFAIDRPYATAPSSGTPDTISDVIVFAALAAAATDTLFELFRDDPNGFWTVGVLYAETLAVELATSNVVKLAVRRPRPKTYELPATETDDEASFYSLHTAFVAGLGATATHLAFARNPSGAEPWLVLAGSAVLTLAVGVERVEARMHFPTDVLTGAVVGAAIGVLVPSLHGRWRLVPAAGGVALATELP